MVSYGYQKPLLSYTGVYSVKNHKKYLNGEWTEDQCLREYLNAFDDKHNKDGVVSRGHVRDFLSNKL